MSKGHEPFGNQYNTNELPCQAFKSSKLQHNNALSQRNLL